MSITIEVNEYISKFSEIKAHIDQALESLNTEEIVIMNDGCSNTIINKIVKYIQNHDVVCIVESKGKGSANRLNKLFGC
jgi:mannose/fructose-specific phosphotransferase system component IIA